VRGMLYKILSRMMRIVETESSQLEEFGARLIRAVSKRSLAAKIILSTLFLPHIPNDRRI